MTGPKRYRIAADGSKQEDPQGPLVDWSEYDALAQAFTLYMEGSLDEPPNVASVLAPMLADDEIEFVTAQLDQRMEKGPPPKGRNPK